MRKRVMHPTDPKLCAVVGVDRALGVFVNVERGGRLAGEYDGLRRGYAGVPGALGFLAKKGFFTEASASLALNWIQHSRAEQAEDPEVRFAGQVAEFLYAPEP